MPLVEFLDHALRTAHHATMAIYPYILGTPRRRLKFLLKEFSHHGGKTEFFEID